LGKERAALTFASPLWVSESFAAREFSSVSRTFDLPVHAVGV
jgi:hypothetical protein